MKPEEAVEVFQKEIKCNESLLTDACGDVCCDDCGSMVQWGLLKEAMMTSIYVLEKQIPKKPEVDPLTIGGVYTRLKCPTCGCRRMGHGLDLDKSYCPECGQRLDFRREEK